MKNNPKEMFSTFQLSKILRISRNTIQASLGADFLIPTKRAKGKHDKSEWDLEGVYCAALYFEMLRTGWPRRRAKEDSQISWENVPGKYKYYIRRSKDPAQSNLIEVGGWEPLPDLKKLTQEENHDIMKFIINLELIKARVDRGIENLKREK